MPSDLFELLPEIGPPWVLTASVTGGAVATLLVLLVVVVIDMFYVSVSSRADRE
jgi:hypothetical protein